MLRQIAPRTAVLLVYGIAWVLIWPVAPAQARNEPSPDPSPAASQAPADPAPGQAPAADTPATAPASSVESGDALPTDQPPEDQLGTYEKRALAQALERTGLQIEPAPASKILGRIHVVNLDVFSPRDGILQLFNYFHRTSRESVVRREVLLEPGQVWNEDVVEETARKLRDPIFTTLVVIKPVRPASGKAGMVDMLVVTRDVWSLRLNSDFEVQESTLSYLLIAPSENNFLGLRKLAAGLFEMDLGEYSAGFLYLDKNVVGKRLQLRTQAEAIFRRRQGEFQGEANELEGERVIAELERPFWSLSSRWSGGIELSHEDHVQRTFRGIEVQPLGFPAQDSAVPDSECAQDPAQDGCIILPNAFRRRRTTVQYSVGHQIGQRFKQRFFVGHRIRWDRPSFVEGFPDDDYQRNLLESLVFPRSERTSELFASYSLFENSFVKLRNLDTFELPEDARFGPSITAAVSAALEPIGSEGDFGRGQVSVSYVLPWNPGGFAGLGLEASTRFDEGELVDNLTVASARVATPMLGGLFRVVARGNVTWLTRDAGNVRSRVRLGGANGLRGFAIGQFPEQAAAPGEDSLLRVIGNVEVRTAPVSIGFTRGGALLFVDFGDANYTLDGFELHADAGFGLRFLVPQLSRLVYRVDWAFPLEGSVFPGRFIFGAGQVF